MVVKPQELRTELLKLLEQIAPEADFDELDPDDDLQEELEIDSFDFLNFLIGISKVYDIEIPERDYAQVRTLASVEQYLIVHSEAS